MTKPNPHLWPQGTTLVVRDRYGEVCRSTDRRFDLADRIMLPSATAQRTVRLSIATTEAATEEMAARLEALISDDLRFDGYRATLDRQVPSDPHASYEWKIKIRPA